MDVPIQLTQQIVETRFANLENAISLASANLAKVENEQVVLNSEIGTMKSAVEFEITKDKGLIARIETEIVNRTTAQESQTKELKDHVTETRNAMDVWVTQMIKDQSDKWQKANDDISPILNDHLSEIGQMKVRVQQIEDVTNKIDYMLSSVIGNGDSLMTALNKIANSVGGHGFQNKSIMEHKLIQYLDKLTGDK